MVDLNSYCILEETDSTRMSKANPTKKTKVAPQPQEERILMHIHRTCPITCKKFVITSENDPFDILQTIKPNQASEDDECCWCVWHVSGYTFTLKTHTSMKKGKKPQTHFNDYWIVYNNNRKDNVDVDGIRIEEDEDIIPPKLIKLKDGTVVVDDAGSGYEDV